MSRAFMLLALLALVCVWVSASPASEMESMLNNVQKNLHKTALQDAFAESDINAEMRYADALLAQKQPEVTYTPNEKDSEGLSFAQQSEGVDMEMFAAPKSGSSKNNKKKTSKASVKSLDLTTGTAGKVNSQCYACQYYLQRFLSGLLGPFYKPNAPGTPIERNVLYTPTNSPISSFIETEEEIEDEEEYASSFLEIESQVMTSLPEAPSAEVAQEQFNKWEPFLSFIEADAEKGPAPKQKKGPAPEQKKGRGPTRKQKIAAVTGKIRALGSANAKPVSSVRSDKGPLYATKDLFSAKRFFSRVCNRRTPAEYIPVCRVIYNKIQVVVEELNVGDRPDEICVRLNLCGSSSYLVARAHTTIRKNDI